MKYTLPERSSEVACDCPFVDIVSGAVVENAGFDGLEGVVVSYCSIVNIDLKLSYVVGVISALMFEVGRYLIRRSVMRRGFA